MQQERGKTPMGTPRHRLCNVFVRVFSVVRVSEASGLTTGNLNLSFEVSAWSPQKGCYHGSSHLGVTPDPLGMSFILASSISPPTGKTENPLGS